MSANKVRYKCFPQFSWSFQSFLEKSTSLLFEGKKAEYKLSKANQALLAEANIDVINIQLLVLPCSRESKSSTKSLKGRRLFIKSSGKEVFRSDA